MTSNSALAFTDTVGNNNEYIRILSRATEIQKAIRQLPDYYANCADNKLFVIEIPRKIFVSLMFSGFLDIR